jgi:hypothetical protein
VLIHLAKQHLVLFLILQFFLLTKLRSTEAIGILIGPKTAWTHVIVYLLRFLALLVDFNCYGLVILTQSWPNRGMLLSSEWLLVWCWSHIECDHRGMFVLFGAKLVETLLRRSGGRALEARDRGRFFD